MHLPDSTYAALLEAWPVARLATVAADGRPHVVPIVFCGHDGVIYSPVDGKAKRSAPLKRLDNVADKPGVSLLLDHYASDWQQLWWVRVDGDADWHEVREAEGETIAARLFAKYPQYDEPQLRFERSAYLRIRPQRVRAWAQSGSVEAIEAALMDV